MQKLDSEHHLITSENIFPSKDYLHGVLGILFEGLSIFWSWVVSFLAICRNRRSAALLEEGGWVLFVAMLVWESQAAWTALPVEATASIKPASTKISTKQKSPWRSQQGNFLSGGDMRWGEMCAENHWALGEIWYFQESFYFLQKLLISWKVVGKKKKKNSSYFFSLRNCANYQEEWICLSYPTPSSVYKKSFCGKSWIQSWICSVTVSLLDIAPDNFSPYVSISL